MKKYFFVLIILAVLSAGIKVSAQSDSLKNTVTVKIDYGKEKKSKVQSIKMKENVTALEALQYVAEVHTHPAGKYVFVDAIDGVRGVREKKGWYYKINGKSADKLAIHKRLSDGDHVTWIYKKDVCSQKVTNTDKCATEK